MLELTAMGATDPLPLFLNFRGQTGGNRMNESMGAYKPDWLEAKQRMTDWWAGKKVDRTVASVTSPKKRESRPEWINASPDKYTDTETIFHNLEIRLNHTFWGGEAFPHHYVYFGPMFTPLIYYGAKPNFMEYTTWYEPCFKSLEDIAAYVPEPDKNEWWRMKVDIYEKTAERSKGAYMVTLGGVMAIIDALAGLYGNRELLYSMADEPENVIKARDAMLRHAGPTFDVFYDIAYECNGGGSMDGLGIWSPGKAITNQCDYSVMISPGMFDRFVFDDLNHVCKMHDYGIYHLDGEEEIRHLDSILNLDKMNLIQWVPSTRFENSFYQDPLNWIGLFKRIQSAGCAVYIMTPHERVKALLNRIDRNLVYLSVDCPDEETVARVLKDLEK